MKRLVNAITCALCICAHSGACGAGFGVVLGGVWSRRGQRRAGQSARAALWGAERRRARLDSAADIAFLLALTAALLRARQLACWLLYAAGAVLLTRSVTYAAGFYKFRTFVSLYTTLNRAAGVVLVGYPVLAVLLGQGTAAWLAAAAGLSALEELVLELCAWTPAPMCAACYG